MGQGLTDKFISLESLYTVGGAALAVYLITNGLRVFLGFYRMWFWLAASVVISLAVSPFTQIFSSLGTIVVFVCNCFVVAFAAVGLNETTAKGAKEPQSLQHGKTDYKWFSSWFE